MSDKEKDISQTAAEQPKSALEEANGNYLMAGMLYFDRLPLPRPVRQTLKGILVFVAAFTALWALLWPLLMPYLG